MLTTTWLSSEPFNGESLRDAVSDIASIRVAHQVEHDF